MVSRRLCFLFFLLVFAALPLHAQFTIVEKDARINLTDKQLVLTVPVVQPPGLQKASISLKLEDAEETVVASSQADLSLNPSQREITASITADFKEISKKDPDDLFWYRLMYEIRTDAGQQLVAGIIPVSTAHSEFFRLAAAAGHYAHAGRVYEIEVNAANPVTFQPVRNVAVKGEFTWDDENEKSSKLEAEGLTDAAGNMRLSFNMPANTLGGEAGFEITGTKGFLTRTVEQDVVLSPSKTILIDTDKPIYQPGQTLHVRSLVVDSQHKVVAGADVDVIVSDQEQTNLFRESLVTDSFGVAHTDWVIPKNVRLGDYTIEVRLHMADSDMSAEMERFVQSVRIYRYDLPNFSVTATPDHPYYLAGQNASVKVNANYLFGKPVKRGKVRVVEEAERHWNYDEQKWEIDEKQSQTGELNENGEFIAKLDLTEKHADLKESTYTRFRTMNIGAYVTDLTTGRTEQRRFQLRVTREPIHVYFEQGIDASKKTPWHAYVSTFYADGTPARCSVQVSSVDEDSPDTTRHYLQTIKTNKYGIGKITGLSLWNDQGGLLLEAQDAKGLNGREVESVSLADWGRINVSTSHSLYKSGEGLEVSLDGPQANMRLLLHVIHDGEVLATRRVTLHGGKAFVVLPYDPRFTGPVSITAFSLSTMAKDYNYPWGSKTVLYPKKRKLGLQVRLDKDTYRPGQDASALLAVKLPDGSATESELGVKIVDQAVEERARTDEEFGTNYRPWSYWGLQGFDRSFGSITLEDLDNMDLSQPIPEELDLVAEYILLSPAYDRSSIPEVALSSNLREPSQVFSTYFQDQFSPLQSAAKAAVAKGVVIKTLPDLIKIGGKSINFLTFKDPWGTPYHFSLSYEGKEQVVAINSAGPDKKFDSDDDFQAYQLQWEYFQYVGTTMEKVWRSTFLRTGEFVGDTATLRPLLLPKGIDIAALRDPWGNPYEFQFKADHAYFTVTVISHGSGVRQRYEKPEITIWTSSISYFSRVSEQVSDILNRYQQKTGLFPETEAAFKEILKHDGLDFDSLLDPWGNHYYLVFRTVPRYSQQVVVNAGGTETRSSTPVTIINREIGLISPGVDKTPDTKDDFEIATYATLVTQQSASDATAKPATSGTFNGNTGAIQGIVTDGSGAVVPGAIVIATNEASNLEYKGTTDANGKFTLLNLSPGLYKLHVAAAGFRESVIVSLPVHSVTLTEANVTLNVGATTEMVTVEAASVESLTSTSMSSVVVRKIPGTGKAIATITTMMSTPRLREYFPETMLWEPALQTTRGGQAQLHFKLADNITNWKLTAIASTKTGELGSVEKDLRSFQPFFVEHDPPRILTEGDEISYPVVLRNYLDKLQSVQATIKPEPWFQLLGPGEQKIRIDAGDASHAVFRYRAIASVQDGKQRITAANSEISDAIEKPLDVHPFGAPESQSDSVLFEKTSSMSLHVPENALPGSLRGELKVYPSLMAHVIESVEAVLERPYGCGEQTISSTYPSLLIVKFYKQHGGEAPPIAARAQRYLQAGYERLLRYQDDSGGFTYWGHGEPDFALTTYALEFLTDASEFIQVDSNVLEHTGKWLVEHQEKGGSWSHFYDNKVGTVITTAYVARVLAEVQPDKNFLAKRDEALKKALQFLTANRGLLLEPYAIASVEIAARTVGDRAMADSLLDLLRNSSHREDEAAYWDLQTNTPFYGWGRTGRLESTALVARALNGANGKATPADHDLIHRAALFLLRNQDRYGVWYSGQTTVNVLQTLIALMADGSLSGPTTLRVMVNGKDAGSIPLPAGNQVSGLLRADLTAFVKPGDNQIELKADEQSSPVSAQGVLNYYTPWPSETSEAAKPKPGALKLQVSYSKTSANENDTIECHVKAERVGFQGYGMMLAEIGLPPGVDVDRESLEEATTKDWTVNHYDVLPDHVLLYLWPKAGGEELTFKFRLRFAMQAETAPSMIYDYYNPDVVVTQKPVKFVVGDNAVMAGR